MTVTGVEDAEDETLPVSPSSVSEDGERDPAARVGKQHGHARHPTHGFRPG